ncbi:hypothetical protein PRECH8_13370 [Insulibacter thermoxylanivorax]|uniref:Uncharacterized protein n=1 Tax=Insulibacter thermoxylanivorax TaxID=2749268 RepID=A0A916QGE7_9BACL|nr:hypothetical protein [Insulibacter thermoxylanivorax]GFR38041.1 hypothetical protein PRECH8_13370 [Insulibacter thermoxylanivorax]
MFHPTVYENLKVAFENYLYDLDNQEAVITITNREDILDMAVMSRQFTLQFALAGHEEPTAEVRLYSSVADLAAEILEEGDPSELCSLVIRFRYKVRDLKRCKEAEVILINIWLPELPIRQVILYPYDTASEKPDYYSVSADVRFNRRIGEGQIEDIPNLAEHMIRSLMELSGKL